MMNKSRVALIICSLCVFAAVGCVPVLNSAGYGNIGTAMAVTGDDDDDDTAKPVNEKITNPIKPTTIEGIIELVINFCFTIAVIVCPLIIIAGGFLMVASGGDPGRVETGKRMVYYALIGLGIVVLAKGFVEAMKMVLKVKKASLDFPGAALALSMFKINYPGARPRGILAPRSAGIGKVCFSRLRREETTGFYPSLRSGLAFIPEAKPRGILPD